MAWATALETPHAEPIRFRTRVDSFLRQKRSAAINALNFGNGAVSARDPAHRPAAMDKAVAAVPMPRWWFQDQPANRGPTRDQFHDDDSELHADMRHP